MSPSSDSSESNGPDNLSREGMNSLQKNDQASENNNEASFGVKTTPDFIPMVRIIFWNSMGFFFFSYLIPFVARELLGASYAQLGLLFSIQTTGGLISAPIVAFLTDRYSKKLLVLIGSSGRAACYFLMYLGIIVSNLYVFGAGMFVLGFFVGFFWTPLNALISQKSNKRNRSAAFGKRAGMIGWGNLLGAGISFVIFGLANTFIPENLFLVYSPLILFGAANIYGGIIFHRKVDEKLTFEKHVYNLFPSSIEPSLISPEIADQDASVKQKKVALPIGFFIGFFVLIIAFMTTSMNQSLAYPYFQVYLREEIGVDIEILIMLIYFPSQVLSPLFAPYLGKVADRINPILGISIVSGMGALVTILILNTTSGIVFGFILLFDSTFAWGGNLILQNFLSRLSKVHRGKMFGAAEWLSLTGAIVGPILGGLAASVFGLSAPFIISIFIELSVIPLYAIAIKKLNPFMAEKLDENSLF